MRDIKPDIDALHILLVEDDLVSQFLMKETLHIWNTSIQVDVADNGEEALERLKKIHYDLILMDIQMPKMDGYIATKIIREEFPTEIRNIPIIAMSGQNSFQYEKYGMDGFIAKPYDADSLYETIQNIFSSKNSSL